MIKKILFSVLVIFILVGAAYSYKKVDFGQKTARLFKVLVGSEEVMRRPPGGAPQGMSGMETSQWPGPDARPEMSGSGESQQSLPGFGPNVSQGSETAFGPSGDMRRGERSPGKIISLEKVIPYAFILAFFVMITRFVDFVIRKRFGLKSIDPISPTP